MLDATAKPHTALLFAASPGVDMAVVRRWQSRLAAAWPEGSQIKVDVAMLAEACDAEQACAHLGTHDGVVLFSPGPETPPALWALGEKADRVHLPVLRLTGGPERRDRRDFCAALRGGGAPMLHFETEPALAAGLLLGLLSAASRRAELDGELLIERAVKDTAARLFEQHQAETQLAMLVQRALLPPPALDIPGIDTGIIYRPCSSLSGDLYDIVRLDEHHLAFFLADASGHGVAAALLTMLIGRLLPMKEVAHDKYRIVPPGEAVARLNSAYVQRQPDSSRLITAMYGVLDLRTGTLTLASAGHPPAAIVSSSGLRLAGESGPSLGLLDDAEFPATTVRLQPGETVLFYSDGFEWAFCPPPPEGVDPSVAASRRRPNEQYLDAFAVLGARPAHARLSESLLDFSLTLDQQHGSLHQPDDITLVAFTWRGVQGEARDGVGELPLAA